MELTTLMTYAAAHAAVTAAPGPIVAVVLSRTLTHDLGGAAGFTLGVCLGKMIAILAIAVGLGVWAAESAEWLFLFRLAGAGYLLWLAARMWDSVNFGLAPGQARRGWFAATTAGTAFSLGSPFTFLFYIMVLPSVMPDGLGSPAAVAALLTVTVLVVGGVLTCVIILARQFRRVVSSPGASASFSRAMAIVLAATSVTLLMV